MEHEQFLKDLHKRLEIWDAHQRIGDILLEMVCLLKLQKYDLHKTYFLTVYLYFSSLKNP